MNTNGFFNLLLSKIFGGNRAATIEKNNAPILVPLEAVAASALQSEVQSVITHNTGFAVQQISSAFDKIGLSGVDRDLAEAAVGSAIQHITVSIGPSATADQNPALN